MGRQAFIFVKCVSLERVVMAKEKTKEELQNIIKTQRLLLRNFKIENKDLRRNNKIQWNLIRQLQDERITPLST